MIDLHTHILPALDDGAATLAESIGMARAAAAEGITTVVATPHVRDDYPTTAAEMEQAVATLRNALAVEAVQLEVETGGEIALDELGRLANTTQPGRTRRACARPPGPTQPRTSSEFLPYLGRHRRHQFLGSAAPPTACALPSLPLWLPVSPQARP